MSNFVDFITFLLPPQPVMATGRARDMHAARIQLKIFFFNLKFFLLKILIIHFMRRPFAFDNLKSIVL